MPKPLQLRHWSPKIAQHACEVRLRQIDAALLSIAYIWGDVNNAVVLEVDRIQEELSGLREAIADAVEYEQERSHA